MPRIRSIKPTFFKSRTVRKLTHAQQLVWIGSWNLADDEGRMIDEPEWIAGELWALKLDGRKVDAALDVLASHGVLIRYTVAGEGFIQVTNWREHQKINRPADSTLPPPSLTDLSVNVPGSGTDRSSLEGKGGERKGGERPQTPFCVKHPSGTESNCRACGDARRAYDAALLADKNKPTPTTPKWLKADDGHEHRRHPTDPVCLDCNTALPVLDIGQVA